MNFEQLIDSINPEIYANLKQALVLGKWSNGTRLTDEQKSTIMEAIIVYENKVDMPEEQRTGYINRNKVEDTSCNSSKKGDDTQPLHLH